MSPGHQYPKLHNAMWPGLVGKEDGTDHPPISLEHMLDMTAAAEVDGQRFDGVDLFLFAHRLVAGQGLIAGGAQAGRILRGLAFSQGRLGAGQRRLVRAGWQRPDPLPGRT